MRALAETAGVNMNTWLVGHHPIAYEHWEPVYTTEGEKKVVARLGRDTFYLKGRIMAGQADLTNNAYGAQEFKWLTREELQEHLHQTAFSSVEKTMPAQ